MEAKDRDGAGGPISLAPGAAASVSWVEKTPGVCGGDACVRSTRVPVLALEGWRRLGLDDAQILAQYPGLNPEDLPIAWEYAAAHPGGDRRGAPGQ